jgi:hypothetical protein
MLSDGVVDLFINGIGFNHHQNYKVLLSDGGGWSEFPPTLMDITS